MMQFLRNGTQSLFMKIFLFGMLGFAMMGLVVMDVGGVFRGGVRSGAVAQVGDQEISLANFDYKVQNALRQQNMTDTTALQKRAVVEGVLHQEIRSRLLSQESLNLGIRINDAVVAKQINEIIQPLVDQGLAKQDAMQRLLYAQGNISEPALVALMKRQLASDQLVNAVVAGAYVPEQMIKDAYRYQYETRRIKYIKITNDSVANLKNPDDAALEAYYKTVSDKYKTAELRSFSYLILNSDILTKGIAVSDEELQQRYDEYADDYHTPEMRTITQVIFQDQGSAEDALAKLSENGGDLNAAVGTSGTIIAAKDYMRKDLSDDLAEVAFTTVAGSVTEPVSSEFGFHIMKIGRITPAKTRSFEEVKTELKDSILSERADDILYETVNEVEDTLASGMTLTEAGEELSLPIASVKDFNRMSKRGFPHQDIVPAAFNLVEGEPATTIETDDGQFIFVGLDAITPAQIRPLAEVKDQVINQWRHDKRKNLTRDKTIELFNQMKDGKTLTDVAKAAGLSTKTVDKLQRSDIDDQKNLDTGFITAAFALTPHDDFMRLPVDDGQILMALDNIDIPNADQMTEVERDGLRRILTQSAQQDSLLLYQQILSDDMGVKINERTLETMYQPTDEYGG